MAACGITQCIAGVAYSITLCAVAGQWSDLSRPPLREAALRRALTEGPLGSWRRVDVVESTGSTNADLAERARAGEAEGAVLIADHQSAGRGRRDRVWTAPPRAGIACSVLLRPADRVPPEHWPWLSLLAGVAVTDALIRTCGLTARLKWPNDVLVPADGRPGAELAKVAGLLAEVVQPGPAVVLGIGLNVSQRLDELPVPTATSLRLAGSATTDRAPVVKAVLRALADRYRDWTAAGGDPKAGLAAAYRERCVTIGSRVRAELPDGTSFEGLAEGVDDAGRLLIFADHRVHEVSAGDVVHIRPAEPA